jgi:hypothetical protein
MLAFPSMLLQHAEAAGMKVPPDVDNYEPKEFPHFHVFCNVQLGRSMNWDEPSHNAEVIAKISDEKIFTITIRDLLTLGFRAKGLA